MLPLARSTALLRNQLAHRLPVKRGPLFTSRSHSTQGRPAEPLQPLLVHGIKSSPLARPFSSTHKTRATSPQTPPPNPSPETRTREQNANPSFESTGFSGMFKGSSRGVKIVVIGALCVVATAESIAWSVWGWSKVKGYFGNGDDGKGGDEGADGLAGSERP
ncbi:uncharacterized protein BP5553_02404 [Venustampulla echinocandica]|uniref:Uncharacterized protein n=1 Tax=Venustampulla echinocandica TaxID=2656787 RepID=A0A370U3S0_9HELO|nr:uncharacterized protein BP5553_02404 [Venustampulla echinocandica]RDL42425.1 hypothetical protein BP5553_02404 [Venustampulla echinocandica]